MNQETDGRVSKKLREANEPRIRITRWERERDTEQDKVAIDAEEKEEKEVQNQYHRW